MALFAKLVSYPPLGQVTVVPPHRKEISFVVVLESSQSFPKLPWSASIWYDHGGLTGTKEPWRALDLHESDAKPTVLVEVSDHNVYRYVWTGILATPFTEEGKTYRGRRIAFTVRYRTSPDAPWQWVKTQFGTNDGAVILQPPIDPNFIAASPVELELGWHLRKLASEAPDARLYSIESSHPIPQTDGEEATTQTKVLGHVTQANRFFALVRIWSPWLAPRHGAHHFHITEDAVLCSFLRHDGSHVVLLAINGIDDILTLFKSDDSGNILVAARNDSRADGKFRLLAATAWDFETANAAVMYEMRKMVRQSSAHQELATRLPQQTKAESTESDSGTVLVSHTASDSNDPGATPQWLESWYDSLAYCTWNSLGQDLNVEKIMRGLQSLQDNKIHIATLIIDDNWQSLDSYEVGTSQFQRGWKSFEASPGFPDGLKAAVTKIRREYPAIKDIAVWHALLGYWGGVSPQGELAKTYKTVEVEKSAGLAAGKMTAIDPADVHRMYDDFYTFLSSCGVTGVKTDAQFFLDLLASTGQRRTFNTAYQSAWTQAHLRHLSGKAISCMSQIPQILYHSFLPTNTPRIMLRNSDDFFPEIPASHPWHVFCNAHTALFVQHLNVLPDWDMFQTDHPYSGFHAAARCVSGGPIYITDTPGHHDVALINQMTALNPRGQTVILRPSNVGKTIGIYDNYTEGHVLKVGVYNGHAEVGTGIMGIFNVADREISFVLPITDIPGVDPDHQPSQPKPKSKPRKWLVRSHMSRLLTGPIEPRIPLQPSMLLQASLAVRGYDIWTALPVHSFILSQKAIDVAVIGLLGKMTGACAILESKLHLRDDKRLKINVQLKALGTLGIWLSDAPERNVEDLMVLIWTKPIPETRVKINPASQLLEIDVEGAWTDMGLQAGYSNEVAVEVLL